MTGLVIAIGVIYAGWYIGARIESLGQDVKAGLHVLADAIREIEE